MSAVYQFTYNIAECRLTGELEVNGQKETFNAYAGSGGRAGSTTIGVVDPNLMNNPFATRVKGRESSGVITKIGGPLPMGIYSLHTHESKAYWIRLNPELGTDLQGRDGGFAIHRRGPNGSIGCIVPSDSHVVIRLYNLLKEMEDQDLPSPKLKVIAEGSDMERFITTRIV